MSVSKIAIVGFMTSITCILGPISIAVVFSPVPVSLGLFGILLTTALLGAGYGTLSCALYILLGLLGLPVFSGFTSGPGVLLGPTGGYLLGYLAVAACSGLFQRTDVKVSPPAQRPVASSGSTAPPQRSVNLPHPHRHHGKSAYLLQGAGFVCGLILCYLLGSLWLSHYMNISFKAALAVGVLPYLPADITKIILALWLGRLLRGHLLKANLF